MPAHINLSVKVTERVLVASRKSSVDGRVVSGLLASLERAPALCPCL
jgi:hypothetical protein